jgi:hypothetical protein
MSNLCARGSVDLTVDARDPDNDPLLYTWSVSGGTIKGEGRSVTWDLSGIGRSEKEIQLASQEIRARDRQHSREGPITAKKLANFLEEVHTEEQFLLQQWRDQELRLVREGFDGDVSPVTTESSQAPAGSTSEEPETELPILSETYGEFVA